MTQRNPDLFRREAIESGNRYGVPIRPFGVASWIITAFMFVVVFSVLTFLCLTQYARKETVIGSLAPAAGAQRLVAQKAGVVEQVLAREGEYVRAGAPIVRFSYDALADSGQSISDLLQSASQDEAGALAAQRAARLTVIQSQIEELDARAAGIRADINQLVSAQDISRERVQLATDTVTAARSLHEQQLMATLTLRQREEALLTARQQQNAQNREAQGLRSQLSQLSAQRGRLLAERTDAAATGAQQAAQFDERRASLLSQQGQLLAARTGGRLAALQVRPGAVVQAGQTVGVVLPEGAGLEAELWVPSRAIGFLKRGGSVRLLYDAFPYQRFGVGRGRIKFVSEAPTNPADMATPVEASEPLYRVIVALDRQAISADGRLWPLTPGMRLTADLVLDERPLIIWLLDPILSNQMRARAA